MRRLAANLFRDRVRRLELQTLAFCVRARSDDAERAQYAVLANFLRAESDKAERAHGRFAVGKQVERRFRALHGVAFKMIHPSGTSVTGTDDARMSREKFAQRGDFLGSRVDVRSRRRIGAYAVEDGDGN